MAAISAVIHHISIACLPACLHAEQPGWRWPRQPAFVFGLGGARRWISPCSAGTTISAAENGEW